jgi:hypothetical protein
MMFIYLQSEGVLEYVALRRSDRRQDKLARGA